MPTRRDKTSRPPRVERPEPVEIISDEGQNWAVSYSDLLMVLMSFFVVFFSFDDNTGRPFTEQIAKTFQLKLEETGSGSGAGTGTGDGKGSGTGVGTGTGTNTGAGGKLAATGTKTTGSGSEGSGNGDRMRPATVKDLEKGIQAALATAQHKLKTTVSPDTLTIEFPENIYKPGRFDVNTSVASLIDQIMDLIKPHVDQVEVVFIGHADASAVTKRNSVITDNFVLSSLRATRALEYAVRQGFPGERCFAQGAASNLLNSRGLSIRVHIPREPQAH